MSTQNSEYGIAEYNVPENNILKYDASENSPAEYDVVEMDFPEYSGEFPPVGGAIPGTSFSAEKTEIYRRNREIAAEMQSEALAAKEQEKADKIAKLERIYEESEAPMNFTAAFGRRARIVFPVITAAFIVVIFVLVIMSVQSSTQLDRSQAAAESASEAAAAMVIPATEVVTRAETTRITRAETEIAVTEESIEEVTEEVTEIPVEILKTTAVREPFEETGTAFVYNTEAMSYRFKPEYTGKQLSVYVTVKNLTDYDYYIVPHFFMETELDEIHASVNESSSKSHYFHAEELIDGEWTENTYKFLAYDFDKDHLCSFRLQFIIYGECRSFSYDPQFKINNEYSEKVDEGFEIPFEELKKYIFGDFPEE